MVSLMKNTLRFLFLLFASAGLNPIHAEELNLDQYSGQVVYVDFWASWCSPCLREMPYSKELQKHFAGREVAFLYLSTNSDRGSWLKGMEHIAIAGHHYRIEPLEKNRFKKYLKVPGIPYYLILDRQGKVFLADAPWPHDRQAQKQIGDALKQRE